MKILYAVLLFMICVGNVFGQNRADVWELGNYYNPGCGIRFSLGLPDTFRAKRQMEFFTTDASICDSNGEMLFYTNGVYVSNRENDSLYNTKNFNPGWGTKSYDWQGLGYDQGAIIIPRPLTPNTFYIFYITLEPIYAWGQNDGQPLHLSCSEVDMNLDNGLGGIVSRKKNIHVIEDTISQGRITACKHANGVDWWIVTHKYHSKVYYKILVASDTMTVDTQSIGNKFTSSDVNGMAVFSPDGSKYAQLNINDTIDLLDFDRCTGNFSNARFVTTPDTGDYSASLGCSFSPDSRFLYVNTYHRLYQFDTYTNDVNASRILIDTVPDYSSINLMFLEQLAPDNKIYISTWGSDALDPFLHVINNPDSAGKSCNIVFQGLKLPPVAGNDALPNFPNYNLGPLAGSGCDTLITNTLSTSEEEFTYGVYPNPCTGKFQLTITGVNSKTEVVIYNEMGEVIQQTTLQPVNGFIHGFFNLQNEPAGVYLLKAHTERGDIAEKLLKE